MSKLSLSKRLLGSSEENPPLPNHQQPSTRKIQAGLLPPKTAPVVAAAQVGSPLSGWSYGTDSGEESPPQNLPQQQQQETPSSPDGLDDTDPFDFEEDPHVLNELYDTFDGDYGDHVTAVYSENEEEEEEETEEGGEDGADEGEEAVDLHESPPSSPSPRQQLDSYNNEMLETEAAVVVEHRGCQVCGIELSSMHYLQQVQHVKQCLSKRHLQGGTTKPPQASASGANPTVATVTTNKRKFLQMDLKEWLHELEFDGFIDKFISEEIDMSLVHALNEDDLSLLGITDLLEQRKFIRAAKKVGAEVQAIKRAKRAATAAKLAAEKGFTVEAKQRKKQQTLQELGISATTTGKPRDHENKNSNSNNVKSAEQALLIHLYPTNNNNNKYRHVVPPPPPGGSIPRATTTATEGGLHDGPEAPLPTPPLPPTTALASARVPHSTSLFTSAAHCKQVTETLESRIEKRRIERPPGNGIDSNEQLGRGGITFTKVEESRALKAMKLQALKEELKMHESTVTELKKLIAGLEEELGWQQ